MTQAVILKRAMKQMKIPTVSTRRCQRVSQQSTNTRDLQTKTFIGMNTQRMKTPRRVTNGSGQMRGEHIDMATNSTRTATGLTRKKKKRRTLTMVMHRQVYELDS